jgi:hypothetical protein
MAASKWPHPPQGLGTIALPIQLQPALRLLFISGASAICWARFPNDRSSPCNCALASRAQLEQRKEFVARSR